jgi:hypothetical protein
MAHGALNTLVTSPSGEWFFKQFISQNQLDQFALAHSLVIVKEQEE